MPARVLIVSAGIGEGHDLPARMIAAGILERDPGAYVPIVDALKEMGKLSVLVAEDGSDVMFGTLDWLFDAIYAVFVRFGPVRRISQAVVHAVGRRGMARLVARERPDAIVSTYPIATEVLGHMRERGRLTVPVASSISDLAALRFWAHPGVDLHLLIHPESDAEVRAIAPNSRIVAVRGMTSPAFETPIAAAQARASLDLPASGPVVVVSGGGWAVGDLAGATEAALEADPRTSVLILCGRQDDVRDRLAARFGAKPQVRVMGFTDRMGEVLAAADVLVHSTAGLTVFEGLLRGCRVVSYGWGVAHIRLNNDAYRRFRLAEVVSSRPELTAAIERGLAAPERVDYADYGAWPSAAQEVLALVAVPATP
jgi:processive 1,2-diacylglycerol beta-glucosyltransferase